MKRLAAAIVLLVGCAGEIDDGISWPPSYDPPDSGIGVMCEKYKFTPNEFYPTEYPVNIILDGRLTYHNIGIMQTAIRTWNDHMGMEVAYPTITSNLDLHNSCNYAVVTDTTDLPAKWLGLTSLGKCGSDFVSIETMQTMMRDRGPEYYTDDLILTLTIHELGHVLGLGHEKDPKSVMFATMAPGDVKYISDQSYCLVQQAVIHTQL